MSSKKSFQLTTQPLGEPEQTVVLISTAIDGPARVPFRLTDSAIPSELLGDTPLFHAYDMAKKSGATDILLYRLNGQYAKRDIYGMVYDTISGVEIEKPVLQVQSVTASEKYSEYQLVFDEVGITIYDDLGEKQRTYLYAEHTTVKELVDSINIDSEHGMISIQAAHMEPSYPTRRLQELNFITRLTGGSSEEHFIKDRDSHKAELNTRLLSALFSDSTYDQENYIINSELGMMDFGVVSINCLHHDDGIGLEETMGRFCIQKANEIGKGCLAVIGTVMIEEPTKESVLRKMNELLMLSMTRGISTPALISEDSYMLDESMESTWEAYVQVVVGDGIRYSVDGLRELRVSLAPAYAGLQSSLSLSSSTTNKSLGGFDHLSYELEKENIDNLLGNGYISIISSIRRGFVPYSETTYVRNTSSVLRNPSAIRVTHYVTRRLTEMLDSSIGSRGTQMSRREMMSRTTAMVEEIFSIGLFKDYKLGFVNSPEAQGHMSIKLDIVPYLEVKSISSLVRLPFIQGGM